MTIVQAVAALAALAAFLGIMIAHVPSPDLIAVIALTFGLAAFDLLRSMGKPRK